MFNLVVVTLLEISEKEEGVVALHLPTGPLKTCSGLEPIKIVQDVNQHCGVARSLPIRFVLITNAFWTPI